MAIDRTNYNLLTDDDGSNTVGTLWTKDKVKTVLLDPIDAAIIAPGGQLLFPATQVPSANVNTLDDYEEGTWTPNLTGTTTYTTQVGTYTKIGRQVTVQCRLKINAIGTGATTNIFGLPFLSIAQEQGGMVGFLSGSATNVVSVSCTVLASNAAIQLYSLTAAAATMGTSPIFTSGTEIMVAATYFT